MNMICLIIICCRDSYEIRVSLIPYIAEIDVQLHVKRQGPSFKLVFVSQFLIAKKYVFVFENKLVKP